MTVQLISGVLGVAGDGKTCDHDTIDTQKSALLLNTSNTAAEDVATDVTSGGGNASSDSLTTRPPNDKLVTRIIPCDLSVIDCPIDLSDALQLELTKSDGIIYDNMLEYLSKHVSSPYSLRLGWMQQNENENEADGERPQFAVAHAACGSGHGRTPNSEIGLGLHELCHQFEDGKKRMIYVIVQTLGLPIGTFREASFFQSLVLFMKDETRIKCKALLGEFLRTVWKVCTKVDKAQVAIWRFDLKSSFWSKVVARKPRDFTLVVLEKEMKKMILDDLSWFLKEDTADFYSSHGIPYHRAYLFFGPPGSGKTSTIFALAGAFERNLCFIQSDIAMTDDNFRIAVGQAPPKSIIVMEDVDSLFTVHRETNSKHSSLTFSGFLNAIDGLASPEDVVFVLTTNHPEVLDPALLRPGRVDVRVEFKTPNWEMAREYFLTYYKGEGAAESAVQFAKNISAHRSSIQASMAQMQHYFLYCHRYSLDAQAAAKEVLSFNWQKPLGREGTNIMY